MTGGTRGAAPMPSHTPRVGIPEQLAARMSMPEQHAYLRTKLTRRGLLRSSAAIAGVVAGAGLLTGSAQAASPALLTSSAAPAVDGSLVAPFGRHLAFGADPATQMRVSRQGYLHTALDGLQPGTTYYYGVGHDGFDPADPRHFATIGTFRTAPARLEPFTFTAFGD